jgi:DNA modification methylase
MRRIEMRPIDSLKPHPKNVRTHSKKQIKQVARSIEKFGFNQPIVIDENDTILAGHARYGAARMSGMSEVPVIVVIGLSEAKKRAYVLADNKIAANGGWDRAKLAVELQEMVELLPSEQLDVSITGFAAAEVDQLIVDFEESQPDPTETLEPEWFNGRPVTRHGDIWLLGNNRLMCGNARSGPDLDVLMGGAQAALVFTDPPYNVRISGVVGRGRVKHREFAEASGEMSVEEFVAFLTETLGNAARVSLEGSVSFVAMDWRHAAELSAAGRKVYGRHLNTVIWVKSSPGQGSFYRSQHEMIFVFAVGRGEYTNNIELGRHGRSRSNVWHYAGVNSFGRDRMENLRTHPTVKPVALIADAIKDCSQRGDIVLDIFSGSGSTILAAERVGRTGYGLEIDPLYVDATVRRWQALTKRDATDTTGRTFDEIAVERSRPEADTRASLNPA